MTDELFVWELTPLMRYGIDTSVPETGKISDAHIGSETADSCRSCSLRLLHAFLSCGETHRCIPVLYILTTAALGGFSGFQTVSDLEFDTTLTRLYTDPVVRWDGLVRTLPVGGIGVGTSEGLGLIAGLVRFAEFDVGGRARLAPRDGPRGQNHVFRPLRGIARRFVRARHISCRECGLADLPHVPGSCETPRVRCEGRDEAGSRSPSVRGG